MDLNNLVVSDPDELPYLVRSSATGEWRRATFDWLTSADLPVIDGPLWSSAVFNPSWRLLSEAGRAALKLVDPASDGIGVLGLICPGRVLRTGGYLRGSLLESLPAAQYSRGFRPYTHVGRALVTRLVIESLRQDGGGKILVQSRKYAVGFYKALGFRSEGDGLMRLDEPTAIALLRVGLYNDS